MKNTRKGFTLVELVIVIAVIAILAAVLIPTFTFVLTKAKENATIQELKSGIDAAYIEFTADKGEVPTTLYKKGTAFTFDSTGADYKYDLTKTGDNYKCVELNSEYHVYLLWNAENGYSIKILETIPTGYIAAEQQTP